MAAGAGADSLAIVAIGAPTVAATLVQLRAWFQLSSALCAAAPVSGWGRSSTMTAARQVTWSMWRPVTVIRSAPLAFPGGELS
jgi:hypothetical protein